VDGAAIGRSACANGLRNSILDRATAINLPEKFQFGFAVSRLDKEFYII